MPILNLIRRALIPILNRWNGSKKVKYYKYLKENQWNSLEENLETQRGLLYDLIEHSLEEVPHYQRLDLTIKDFSENSIFEDLKQLPFLTKATLRESFSDLKAKNNPRSSNTYENTSGGSTGEPVRFIQDDYYSNWGSATAILHDKWAGRKIGEPKIILWGSERDIMGQKESLRSKIGNWIRNTRFQNSFKMSQADMAKYIDEINSYQPKLILAYVQSIYELAKYARENDLEVYPPNSIMTSAGVLYPKYRDLISSVFNCPVFNRYGSREVGDMACGCEEHEGLHQSVFTHYLEIVNEDGERCDPGQMGEIVVTSLRNYTMPLIRYKIGDMGISSDQNCSCGRGLPLLEKVVGRTVDVFMNKNGDKIDGEYFTHLFYYRDYINKFQVVQEKKDYIVIKVILEDKQLFEEYHEEFSDIKQKIKLVMGEETEVEYKLVDDIPPSDSGKYRYTISKV